MNTDTIIADMQAASDAVDAANGTSEYNARLVALALVARHFLRESEPSVPISALRELRQQWRDAAASYADRKHNVIAWAAIAVRLDKCADELSELIQAAGAQAEGK